MSETTCVAKRLDGFPAILLETDTSRDSCSGTSASLVRCSLRKTRSRRTPRRKRSSSPRRRKKWSATTLMYALILFSSYVIP